MDNIVLLLNFTLPLHLYFFFAIANTYNVSKPAENHCSSWLLYEHGEVNTLKLIRALCPPRLVPHTLLHFSAGREVRPLQPTTRSRGNRPKSATNFLLSETRVSKFSAKAIGHVIRRATQAERPHMTSPVLSAFNKKELRGLQRAWRVGSKSITRKRSRPCTQRFLCLFPHFAHPLSGYRLLPSGRAPACGTALGFPRHHGTAGLGCFFFERVQN